MSQYKLNIGCGPRNFGEGWIHIDGGDYPHLDYKDITRLEFEDESVDLIYASHVLEYFDREEAAVVLKEWRRVLKIGGILRLAVPDFEVIRLISVDLIEILGPLYGKMKMGDEWIYHNTIYNFQQFIQFISFNMM